MLCYALRAAFGGCALHAPTGAVTRNDMVFRQSKEDGSWIRPLNACWEKCFFQKYGDLRECFLYRFLLNLIQVVCCPPHEIFPSVNIGVVTGETDDERFSGKDDAYIVAEGMVDAQNLEN